MNPSIRRFLRLFLVVAWLLAPARRLSAKSSLALLLVLAPEGAQEGGEGKYSEGYKIINFVLLIGIAGFLLRKPLAGLLVQRSALIRKSLEEGRRALEASQAQLREAEQKLSRLAEEIRAFEEEAAREMRAERERLRKTTGEEAEKILESAQAQVEAATRVGIFELRKFAAQEALKLGEQLIRERLDDSSRKRLVGRFVEELVKK